MVLSPPGRYHLQSATAGLKVEKEDAPMREVQLCLPWSKGRDIRCWPYWMYRSRNLLYCEESDFKLLLGRWHMSIECRDLFIEPNDEYKSISRLNGDQETYISAGSRQSLHSTYSHHGADLSLAFFSSFKFLGPGPSSSLPLGRFFPFGPFGVSTGSPAPDDFDRDGPALAFCTWFWACFEEPAVEDGAGELDVVAGGEGDLPKATKSWSIVW
jgi:hypothetical protein